MRRSLVLALALAMLSPASGRADPGPLWSSPMAAGPTDAVSLAARGPVVLAGGRPPMKEASRVVPGPPGPGLFRSPDFGRTWALASEPVTDDEGQVRLVPITRTPDRLGMPQSGAEAYALFGTEVWRSDDDGSVWNRVGTAPAAATALAFLSDGRPLVGLATGGLRVSPDRGVTWNQFGAGLPGSRVNAVLVVDGSILLVGTNVGLYRDPSGGSGMFVPITTGLVSPSNPVAGVTGESGTGLFLAMTGGSNIGSHIYQSLDLGVTWTLRPPAAAVPIPRVNPGAFELAVTSLGGGAHALYAGSASGLHVASLYAGNGSGSSVSAPGLAWTRSDPEPGLSGVSTLARTDSNTGPGRSDAVYASVSRASIFVTGFGPDEGFAAPGWYDEVDGGRGCGGSAVLADGTAIFACGRHVFRSRDGGARFEAVSDGLPYIVGNAQPNDYFPLEASADGSLWTSGFADGLYRSNPSHTTWTKVAYPGASVGILEAHPADAKVLYASGLATNHTEQTVLWRTRDGGLTWLPVPGVGSGIRFVSASPAGSVLASSDGGTFLSTDGGDTWLQPADLPANTDHAVFSAVSPSVAWAAAGTGAQRSVYRSDDGGRRWSEVGTSFPGGAIIPSPWDVDVLYTSGFQASHDGGLTWKPFLDGLPTGFGTVRGDLVADPRHPGRLYALGGFIDSSNAPTSQWVYRAQDPDLAAIT